MDYEHYILQGEAKSTEFSDDRSYLLVQKANSHCACVGQTEECCLPKIDEIDDFGSLLYSCLDRCVRCLVISTLLLPHLSKQKSFQVHQLFGPPDLIWSLHMCALCGDFKDWAFETSNLQKKWKCYVSSLLIIMILFKSLPSLDPVLDIQTGF